MTIRKIRVARPVTDQEEINAVATVIESGNFVSGRKVSEFEKNFSKYIGVKGSSAVNSGTAAIHISLSALGIGPGDEVIVPSLTFMSTVTAVLHQNAVPVFADIEIDSYCLDPKSIEQHITDNTKAIIPVHLYGNSANMDSILSIARKYELYVIEDCAQAIGTEFKGKRVGSFGDCGTFSFYATKHMTTGEGGMITSNRTELLNDANIIRNHGMVGRDDHIRLGYNYRMNEMSAALGVVQLDKLEKNNKKRIQNSEFILQALDKHKDKWFKTPYIQPHIKHSYFWCPLEINTIDGYDTKDVVSRLKKKGIEVRQRYTEPLYKQAIFTEMSPYPRGCPYTCKNTSKIINYSNLKLDNVEKIAGNVIGLPNHPDLTTDDLEYIVDCVLNLY